jgi:hypothetical protein
MYPTPLKLIITINTVISKGLRQFFEKKIQIARFVLIDWHLIHA